LVLESGQRLVVEAFSRVPGTRFVLRPSRKRLFPADPDIPSLLVELNKPAFAALVPLDDPSGSPSLVFETDAISAGIRDLYRGAGIPFVEADQVAGRGSLRFEKPGFSAKLGFDDRGADTAVESILCWSSGARDRERGRLVRNDVERAVTEAIASFSDELGVAINHHVPFGYAAGYRPDLPRSTARHTIEVSLSMRPEVDPEVSVVLPIRVELKHDHERDDESLDRDSQVAEFVCAVGMPMAAVQPIEGDCYRVTYSLDGEEDIQINLADRQGWADAFRRIAEHALARTGKALVH
jgi:hypothetical protein